MKLIYFDESGNTGNNLLDPQQPIFVLAALIVPHEKWQSLEKSLNDSFHTHFPSMANQGIEVHSTDLVSGRNEFKGVNIDKRIQFRDEWMKIACDAGLGVTYRSIHKSSYSHWQNQTFGAGVAINPQVAAFALLSVELDKYLASADELGMFIFDDNKEVTHDIEKSLVVLKSTNKVIKIEHVIEKGFFIRSAKSRVLQLCDMFAFAARKKEELKQLNRALKYPEKSAMPYLEQVTFEGDQNRATDVVEWLSNNEINDGA